MPSEDRPAIPIWQRVVFGALLPLLVGTIVLIWLGQASALGLLLNFVKTMGVELGLIVVSYVDGFLGLACMFMILFFVIRSSRRPWKVWWSALLGGLQAVLLGMITGASIGALVFLLLIALTK